MIDGTFDVVFRGQIVKNFDEATVKNNLVKLFKSSPEAIERLFSGIETPIRRGLDYTAAMKYQTALKNAGALALIKEVESAQPQSQPAESSSHAQSEQPATTSTSNSSDTPVANAQPAEQSASVNEQVAPTTDTGGNMTLAEAGERILPDKIYEKREVDTSELSLAAAGERIMPEKAPEKHAQPNIDHLAISNDTTPIGGE